MTFTYASATCKLRVALASSLSWYSEGQTGLMLPQSIATGPNLQLRSPGWQIGCGLFPQSTATGPDPHLGSVGRHGALKLPQSTATCPNRHFKSVGEHGVTEFPQSTATGAFVCTSKCDPVTKINRARTIATIVKMTALLPQFRENRSFVFIGSSALMSMVDKPRIASRSYPDA